MSTELVENITCSRRPSDQCPLLGDSHAFPHPLDKPWLCSLSYQHQFVSFSTLLSLSYKIALQVPPSSSKSMQRQAHLFVGKQLRLSICLSFLGYLWQFWQKQDLTASCSTETAFFASHKAMFTLNAKIERKTKKRYVVACWHGLLSCQSSMHCFFFPKMH